MERAHRRIECNTNVDVIVQDKEQMDIDLVVKTFLNIDAAFEDSSYLMEIVRLLLNECELPDNLTPAQRSFCSIFKLQQKMPEKYTNEQLSELKRRSATAYRVIASFPDIKTKYSSDELQRFVQHLVFHLFAIAKYAIDLNESSRTDSKPFLASYCLGHFATGFYAFGFHINHSCIPNVSWFCAGNRLVCTAIRPIKKGEQLLRSYL